MSETEHMSGATQTNGGKGPRKSPSRLTVDPNTLFLAYIHSDKSIREIAEEHNQPPAPLSALATRNNWVRCREHVRQEISKSVNERVVKSGIIAAAEVQQKHAKVLQAQITRLDRMIGKMVDATDADKDTPATKRLTLDKFRTYAEARSKLYADQRRALGIVDTVGIDLRAEDMVPEQRTRQILEAYRQGAHEADASRATVADWSPADGEGGEDCESCDIIPPPGANVPPTGALTFTPSAPDIPFSDNSVMQGGE